MPATVVELAAKAGRPLPVGDPAELYRYDSLDSFLAVFWLVQETLIEPADWARDRLRVADRRGRARAALPRDVLHAGAPLAAGQDLGGIVAGLTEGIEAAEAEAGVRAC